MPGKVDLLFVLDRSGSIGLSNFKQAILFIKALLKYFSISAGTTRVALISYSTHVMTDFQFNSYQNRECVYTALDKVK